MSTSSEDSTSTDFKIDTYYFKISELGKTPYKTPYLRKRAKTNPNQFVIVLFYGYCLIHIHLPKSVNPSYKRNIYTADDVVWIIYEATRVEWSNFKLC
jgi:hypothetical protein